VTDPFAVPVAPALIVIHAALLVDVQSQPIGAVTVMLPAAAASEMIAEVGEIDGVQGAPPCVRVKVLPPTVRVPVREVVVGLVATL
jgi:hypothetical protein